VPYGGAVTLFFLFVQFEFTHALGPHAARYIVDDRIAGDRTLAGPQAHTGYPDEGAHSALEARNQGAAGVTRGIGVADVLVVGVVGASASRPRVLRRARYVEQPGAPADVPLSLVTFVKGTVPLSDKREARQRLDAIRFSEQHQNVFVQEALGVLNVAIRAHRAGAHDPYAIEVTLRDARRVRIGYGATEQVQEGLWEAALELSLLTGRRSTRVERLRPADAVAAVLSGRTGVLEAEDLLLRALVDLDNHRTRGAAFQVGAAIRLLPLELGPNSWDAIPGVRSLEAHAHRTAELEAAAGSRELDSNEVGELEAVIDAVDGVLESWRYQSGG
jgi:hypothetical protein